MASRALGRYRLIVAILVGGLLATACGSGGGAEGDQTGEGSGKVFQIGMVGEQPSPGKPTRGETLTFAALTEAASLDPADTIASGTTGESALAAIYDVLMRYDPGTQKYVPYLAKSLSHSNDYRNWIYQLSSTSTIGNHRTGPTEEYRLLNQGLCQFGIR